MKGGSHVIGRITAITLACAASMLCGGAGSQHQEKECLVNRATLNPQGSWFMPLRYRKENLEIMCQAAYRESAIYTVKDEGGDIVLEAHTLRPGDSVEFNGPAYSYSLVLHSLVVRDLFARGFLPHGRKYAGIISVYRVIAQRQLKEPEGSSTGQEAHPEPDTSRPSTTDSDGTDASGNDRTGRRGLPGPQIDASTPKQRTPPPFVGLLVGLTLLLVVIILILRYSNQRGKQILFALLSGLAVSAVVQSLNMDPDIEVSLWWVSGSGCMVFIVILLYFFIEREPALDQTKTSVSKRHAPQRTDGYGGSD
jgi:hypothetical protein